jgi:hypothetical protein
VILVVIEGSANRENRKNGSISYKEAKVKEERRRMQRNGEIWDNLRSYKQSK